VRHDHVDALIGLSGGNRIACPEPGKTLPRQPFSCNIDEVRGRVDADQFGRVQMTDQVRGNGAGAAANLQYTAAGRGAGSLARPSRAVTIASTIARGCSAILV